MGTAQASEVTPQSEPLDVEDYLEKMDKYTTRFRVYR
jgi:hypothetical protein